MRGQAGFSLWELTLANAMSMLVLLSLVSLLLLLKKTYGQQSAWIDLLQRQQLIVQWLYADVKTAKPQSLTFAPNSISLQVQRYYQGHLQWLWIRFFVKRNILYETINHKRADAIVTGVSQLQASIDPLSKQRGVAIKLLLQARHPVNITPLNLYVALRAGR